MSVAGWRIDKEKREAFFTSPNYNVEVSVERWSRSEISLRVVCDDDDKIYAHGSYTVASIPLDVLREIIPSDENDLS